jgi:hypothetical protein
VRIWVRIGPPHPHASRRRRLNGAVLRMRPEKNRGPVSQKCGTILKIPPCSKALSAERRPKFWALHRQWWPLHLWAGRKIVKNQSIVTPEFPNNQPLQPGFKMSFRLDSRTRNSLLSCISSFSPGHLHTKSANLLKKVKCIIILMSINSN